MRDCPDCRTPLHGYEDMCPSCGAKQYPTRSGSGRMPYGTAFKPEEPRVNMAPFVLGFLGLAIFVIISMQNTWIGHLMNRPEQPVDPIEKMTYLEAREAIESGINQGLTAAGAGSSKMTWTAGNGMGTGKPEERMADGPVDLQVATSLPSAESRKQIIDPIKPYMEKAKLFTLTMTDSRSHATWTYNMQPGVAPSAGEGE